MECIIAIVGIVLLWVAFRTGVLGIGILGMWIRGKLGRAAYVLPILLFIIGLIIGLEWPSMTAIAAVLVFLACAIILGLGASSPEKSN